MKGRMISAMALVLVFGAAAPALANHDMRDLNRTERRLEMRIDRGIRIGEITRQEARTLRVQLSNLHRLGARFRSDGRLSWRERQILDRDANRLSGMIDRFLANDRDRRDNDRWGNDRWNDGHRDGDRDHRGGDDDDDDRDYGRRGDGRPILGGGARVAGDPERLASRQPSRRNSLTAPPDRVTLALLSGSKNGIVR